MLVETEVLEEELQEAQQEEVEMQQLYVLHVDEFSLVLEPRLPCLRVAPRNYVFPRADDAYALVLPARVPDDEVEVLEIIFDENSVFRVAAKQQCIEDLPVENDMIANLGHSVARGIQAGSQHLASGVVRGSQVVGGHIMRGAQYVKSKVAPVATPSEVPEPTKQRVSQAQVWAGAAANVSKSLATGAIATSAAISRNISDAVVATEFGRKLSKRRGAKATAVKSMASAAVQAVVTAFEAVECAAVNVASSVADAAVDVAEHRYGEDVAATTRAGFDVVGNVGQAALAIRRVGVTSIAGRTARYAAVDIVSNEQEREQRRATRPTIDPVAGVQAAVAVQSLANAIQPPVQGGAPAEGAQLVHPPFQNAAAAAPGHIPRIDES